MGGIITMFGYLLLGNSRGPRSFSVYLCPHEPRASREQSGSEQGGGALTLTRTLDKAQSADSTFSAGVFPS